MTRLVTLNVKKNSGNSSSDSIVRAVIESEKTSVSNTLARLEKYTKLQKIINSDSKDK